MANASLAPPCTSREAFQTMMELSLNGDPAEAEAYAAAVITPDFWRVLNGDEDRRQDYAGWVEHIRDGRRTSRNLSIEIHEFLRDGNTLAVRTSGTLEMVPGAGGFEVDFEVMMLIGVAEDGRMKWLREFAAQADGY